MLTGGLDQLLLALIDRSVWIVLRSVTLHCRRLQFLKVMFPYSSDPLFFFVSLLGLDLSCCSPVYVRPQVCGGKLGSKGVLFLKKGKKQKILGHNNCNSTVKKSDEMYFYK